MQATMYKGLLSVVLVAMLTIVACSARPPRGESVFGENIQDNGSPMDGNANNGDNIHPLGHFGGGGALDDNALAALQLQLMQQYANYNSMRNIPWEQMMLRAPQDKRQIRYRQCYFNPISCFRK